MATQHCCAQCVAIKRQELLLTLSLTLASLISALIRVAKVLARAGSESASMTSPIPTVPLGEGKSNTCHWRRRCNVAYLMLRVVIMPQRLAGRCVFVVACRDLTYGLTTWHLIRINNICEPSIFVSVLSSICASTIIKVISTSV